MKSLKKYLVDILAVEFPRAKEFRNQLEEIGDRRENLYHIDFNSISEDEVSDDLKSVSDSVPVTLTVYYSNRCDHTDLKIEALDLGQGLRLKVIDSINFLNHSKIKYVNCKSVEISNEFSRMIELKIEINFIIKSAI